MNLAEQRKRLHDYLNSVIFNDTIYSIAKKRLEAIYLHYKSAKEPSNDDVVVYIRDHYDELQQYTNKTIEQLVKEILPDDNFVSKIKRGFQVLWDLGVLSILLIPILYVCARYLIIEYRTADNINECADGLVACLFIFLLLGFSIYGYFRNK